MARKIEKLAPLATFEVRSRWDGSILAVFHKSVREVVLSELESKYDMEPGTASEEEFEIVEV